MTNSSPWKITMLKFGKPGCSPSISIRAIYTMAPTGRHGGTAREVRGGSGGRAVRPKKRWGDDKNRMK